MENIRNFCIIAHIDSGKSTLADRFLEFTGTVPPNKMRPQYLDKMELERERGITIKMAPVRMAYKGHILNLIDTPGHSDFSYEVSRALAAVEGAILLVDGTKGIQAQTLSNLRAAQKAGLSIIGAVNKIDLNLPNIYKVIEATASLLGVSRGEIFKISAKNGDGARELLDAIIERIPPPSLSGASFGGRSPQFSREGDPPLGRALVFDSLYDDHKGILAFVRVFSGEFLAGDMQFAASAGRFKAKEVGYFSPELRQAVKLSAGEIGYIATGIKGAETVRVGDTVLQPPIPNLQFSNKKDFALPGYKEPGPVVFISFYPDGKTKFEDLKRGIERLRLSDPALSVEPEANEALGRGLKIGFLGQLHFEIIASRLEREFGLEFLTSFPTIAYMIEERGIKKVIKQPQDFPDKPDKARQPMIRLEILAPKEHLNSIAMLKNVFDLDILEVQTLGDGVVVEAKMPLAELIRDFDDKLKSASQGYASFSYELAEEEEADVVKLEILVVGDVVPALTRIVAEKDLEREARQTVERLKELLPKQQFSQAIQARAHGRIIARETIPAMKKLLGNFGKTGGDRTRKMKLWKKQARGKEKLQSMARVDISPETFREILKK